MRRDLWGSFKSSTVEIDASDFEVGAVLDQRQNGDEKFICYLGRSLTR